MNDMNVGVQPLDAIMTEKEIRNNDLVSAMPPGFINHKQVQKARKGRRLTPHMQEKVHPQDSGRICYRSPAPHR